MSALLGEAHVADAMPKEKSLEEHDKEKHPYGFNPKTDTCKFRDRIATETGEDKADIENPAEAPKASKTGSDTTKKAIVTPDDIRGEVSAKKNYVQGKEEAYPQKQMGISHIFTGSAANYDKPSLLRVGTGTGNQVYGWGLYGSNQRGDAEGYAAGDVDKKSGIGYIKNGKLIEQFGKLVENKVAGALALWGDVETAIEEMKGVPNSEDIIKELKEHGHEYREYHPQEFIYEQTFFTDRKEGDESHLLSWFEPVSEENKKRIAKGLAQSWIEKLRALGRYTPKKEELTINAEFERLGGIDKKMSGEKIYSLLSERLGSPKAASELLAESNIDGIKYPADSYRSKEVKNGDEVGWNYVSFRDDNIRIDKKYVDGKKMFDYQELMAKHHSGIDPMAVLAYLTRIDSPEEMAAEFARIMESGKIEKDKSVHDELYEALVKDEGTLKDQTLQEHDKAHHPGGYHEGDTCKFRDKIKEVTPEDQADELSLGGVKQQGTIEKDGSSGERKSIRSKLIVSPEEDAAYLEAAENGDEKAVKRLFEKAAKRYLADSKVQSKVWHNTKKKFTEFRNNFPNVFFFAKDRKWADIFGKEERYSMKENTKPYYVRLEKPLDMRGERTGNEWLKFFEDNGIKLGEKGVEKLSKVGEETLPGWAILNHDISEPHGPGFRDSMVAAGFDGAAFEDTKRGTADRTTYGVFNSNAIKSADPVTYDDEGHVIPLSRRFDDGDDIRGDVSGKTEYIEKMKSLHPNIDPEELIDRLKNLGSRDEMEAEIAKILCNK